MTSMQRVAATLAHREPDRVPFFLMLSLHGARELGLGMREYFSRGEYVAEAQLRMRQRYRHDCLDAFFHAAGELAAWGGEVIYREDGPATAAPLLTRFLEIERLEAPEVGACPALQEVLTAIRIMKRESRGEVPIVAVAVAPFSLPVMQLGFEGYLQLIYQEPALFRRLMAINTEFCVNWANAQLDAGATVVCYFDPVSSPTIVPPDLYRSLGFPVARATLERIKGPTAIHLASGRSLAISAELAETGAVALGVGSLEELDRVKESCSGKLAVLGNLNGIEMRGWTPELASAKVREAIAKGGAGGGFILCDSHGEIPLQVSNEVLSAISDAVHTWGNYPLRFE
jgi:uroporphyrinogen decarboxylase